MLYLLAFYGVLSIAMAILFNYRWTARNGQRVTQLVRLERNDYAAKGLSVGVCISLFVVVAARLFGESPVLALGAVALGSIALNIAHDRYLAHRFRRVSRHVAAMNERPM